MWITAFATELTVGFIWTDQLPVRYLIVGFLWYLDDLYSRVQRKDINFGHLNACTGRNLAKYWKLASVWHMFSSLALSIYTIVVGKVYEKTWIGKCFHSIHCLFLNTLSRKTKVTMLHKINIMTVIATGPFWQHGLSLITTCVKNHIPSNVRGENAYPLKLGNRSVFQSTFYQPTPRTPSDV